MAKIVLPVFRATGVAWAAAKFPAQATEFSAAYPADHVARTADRAATRDTGRAAALAATAAGDANYAHAAVTAAADAYGGRASALRSAVSFDATGVEEGFSASVIAESMLWPQSHPDQLQSLWQEMKAELRAAGQDWQVWTTWYDDRLEGHVRGEEHELA